jgi:transcriptional regulator with XRE-family HTH domain
MTRHSAVSTKARHLRQLLRVALGQEEIGQRIKQAREESGFTQAELADKIDVATAQSISRYERGETEVSAKRLRRIAEATGKPLSFFVLEPGDEVSPEEKQNILEAVDKLQDDVAEILRRLPPAAPKAGSEPH